MNDQNNVASADTDRIAERALRRLFLTLFLRGRSSRGLNKKTAPKSVGTKLLLSLAFYLLFGLFALAFMHQTVFALSVYLHGMSFIFLGMFMASSSGEVLFNKEEGDILLHRPISSKMLLKAKVRTLVSISLWLAFAFNLAGLCIGPYTSNGDWRFPVLHSVSLILEALFCTGCVVLLYQLCLRWFGRERLDNLMTMAQIGVSIAAVLGGQILPQLMPHINKLGALGANAWWIMLVPPAWFAGIDDALAGSCLPASPWLALGAVAATVLVLWLAFDLLAHSYETGLQKLNEGGSVQTQKSGGMRWLNALVKTPPFSWWLRDPVARASFVLTTAYMIRDRDTKLRLYPALAPMVVLPMFFLARGGADKDWLTGSFGLVFATGYLGLVPMQSLMILQYSQNWQASDVFRSTPIAGPAQICNGARRAVLCFLTVPMVLIFCVMTYVIHRDATKLLLLLPGIVLLPVMAMIPNLSGGAVPLTRPIEEAKSANRGLIVMGAMFFSVALGAVATWAWAAGWFWWLILAEAIVATTVYIPMQRSLVQAKWESAE